MVIVLFNFFNLFSSARGPRFDTNGLAWPEWCRGLTENRWKTALALYFAEWVRRPIPQLLPPHLHTPPRPPKASNVCDASGITGIYGLTIRLLVCSIFHVKKCHSLFTDNYNDWYQWNMLDVIFSWPFPIIYICRSTKNMTFLNCDSVQIKIVTNSTQKYSQSHIGFPFLSMGLPRWLYCACWKA